MQSLADIAAASPGAVPWNHPVVMQAVQAMCHRGANYAEVASRLSALFGAPVTKSAISGAVSRQRQRAERLGGVPVVIETLRMRAPPHARAERRLPATLAAAEAEIAALGWTMRRVTLAVLGNDECKFPVGYDGQGRHVFCGCPRQPPAANKVSGPYCEPHTKAAWTKDREPKPTSAFNFRYEAQAKRDVPDLVDMLRRGGHP